MAKNKRGERGERERGLLSRQKLFLSRDMEKREREREIKGVRGKRIGRGNLPLFLPHERVREEEKERGKRLGGRTPRDRKFSIAI